MSVAGKRLGSGTQANVYAALYQGAPVALKVMTVSNCRENLRELAVEVSAQSLCLALAAKRKPLCLN